MLFTILSTNVNSLVILAFGNKKIASCEDSKSIRERRPCSMDESKDVSVSYIEVGGIT